jgi:hypothetical protein
MTRVPFQPSLDPIPPPIPVAPPPPPTYPLHDSVSIGIATFLGSPIAGTILMAINYRRLGKASAGIGAVLLGVLGAGVALSSGLVDKTGRTSMGISFGLLIATIKLARQLQGAEIEVHRVRGGKIASRWVGAGVGFLLGASVIGGALVWFVFLHPPFEGTRLAIGAHDEIYYSGSVSEAQARALGDVLTKEHYFGEAGATVQFDKSGGKTTISFVVQEKAWDKSDVVEAFKEMTADIAPLIGGLPITMRLVDDEGDSHKELIVTEQRKKHWSAE